MKKKPIELSVIIPCLNEATTLGNVIKEVKNILKIPSISCEIIVIDNASTDRSTLIAKKQKVQVVICKEKGYGNVLLFGIDRAKGEYILMMDADGSYNPKDILALWKTMKYSRQRNDLIIGTRLKGTIHKGAMPFLHRYIGTPVLTRVLNFFFHTSISDCNSGMRLFKKDSIIKLNLQSEGMEFASEMLVKAGIARLRIDEIPITYFKDRRKTKRTSLRTWRDGWRHLKLLFSYAPHYFFILPGILLFIVGTLFVISQYQEPFSFGPIYLDIHIMILGVLCGFLGSGLLQMGIVLEKDAWKHGYQIGWFFTAIRHHFSPELGSLVGFLIFGVGFFLDTNIFLLWIHHNFSNIHEVRKAITATYFMYLGFQCLFFSFFLDFISRYSKIQKRYED